MESELNKPLVSVGLPVFNGEDYLELAARSVLQQDFYNLELIISDNNSTDATPALCRALADSDPRVRVVRQKTNVGAAPNFNLLPGLARGDYFKWMAHDDLIAPDYIGKCVSALEAAPDALLCYTDARIIDSEGEEIGPYRNPLDLGGAAPEARFAELVKFHLSARYEIFGLYRTAALLETDLIGGFTDGDGVLLAQIGLRGPIAHVAEPLFFPRRHAAQSQRLISDKRAYDEWFDPANARNGAMPHFRLFRAFLDIIDRAPLTTAQRRACRIAVFRQALRKHNLLRGDLLRRYGGGLGRIFRRSQEA